MENHEPVPSGGRACTHCGGPIPAGKRSDTKFCKEECGWAANRVRNKGRRTEHAKLWAKENRDIVNVLKKRSAARCRIADVRVNMLTSAKCRAKKQGLPFNLTLEDLGPLPEYCPVLGIPLELGTGHFCDGSPSLDKVVPSLGYTKGNVLIVSWRANRIKSNATIHELQTLASFYTNLVSSGGWLVPPAR